MKFLKRRHPCQRQNTSQQKCKQKDTRRMPSAYFTLSFPLSRTALCHTLLRCVAHPFMHRALQPSQKRNGKRQSAAGPYCQIQDK